MQRRKFLAHSIAASGAIAMNPFPHHLFISDEKRYAHDRVTLGNTGINVSRLAMGTGTHGVGGSSNQSRKLGIKGLSDLLFRAYDHGVNFWESADQYGTHPHLKAGLQKVDREKVVVLTKTHATTEKEMKADLDRFRRELGTDYIDIVLLHCMMDKNWPTIKKGAMEVLGRAREDGIIRSHGVSCHTIGALRAAADSDWVQVNLARFNPTGVRMDADVNTVRTVMEKMDKKGKGIIGMKIFGAGRLTDKIDKCLQFALAQDFMDCFTIGQESAGQFHDLLKRIPVASTRG